MNARNKVIIQLPIITLKLSHFSIKQCLKGKSVACNRSKEINERLASEASGNMRGEVTMMNFW